MKNTNHKAMSLVLKRVRKGVRTDVNTGLVPPAGGAVMAPPPAPKGNESRSFATGGVGAVNGSAIAFGGSK